MGLDIGKIVNFSAFEWTKQEGIWKFFTAYFVFLLAFALVSLYFSSSISNFSQKFFTATFSEQMNLFIHVGLFIILLVIASILIQTAFTYLFIAKALKSKKMSYVEINFSRWARLFVLEIAIAIFALFSIFNLKKLWVLGGALVSIVLTTIFFVMSYSLGLMGAILGLIFFIISIALLIWYLVIVIRNSMRLCTAPAVFVEKERGLIESMKLAWEKSEGKLWGIFGAILVVTIIAAVVGLIFSIPTSIYIATQVLGKILTGAAGGISTQAAMQNDPTYIVLYAVSIIGQAIAGIMQVFVVVGIYHAIKEETLPIQEKFAGENKQIKEAVFKEKAKQPGKRSFKKK